MIVLLQNSEMPPPFTLKLPLLFGLFWSSGCCFTIAMQCSLPGRACNSLWPKATLSRLPNGRLRKERAWGCGEGVTGALKGRTSAYGLRCSPGRVHGPGEIFTSRSQVLEGVGNTGHKPLSLKSRGFRSQAQETSEPTRVCPSQSLSAPAAQAVPRSCSLLPKSRRASPQVCVSWAKCRCRPSFKQSQAEGKCQKAG